MTRDLAVQAGRVLKDLRGDITPTEAAAKLGISRPSLYRLENGQENVTLARLERIAAGYGVELEITAVNPDPS